jgi:hypothetical protein
MLSTCQQYNKVFYFVAISCQICYSYTCVSCRFTCVPCGHNVYVSEKKNRAARTWDFHFSKPEHLEEARKFITLLPSIEERYPHTVVLMPATVDEYMPFIRTAQTVFYCTVSRSSLLGCALDKLKPVDFAALLSHHVQLNKAFLTFVRENINLCPAGQYVLLGNYYKYGGFGDSSWNCADPRRSRGFRQFMYR